VAFDGGTGGQVAPTAAGLAATMRAAGLDPARVALVAVSHFHGDHISGLTTREDAVVFPNAEVAVPQAEWAYWTDEGAAARAPEGQRPTFANTRRRSPPTRRGCAATRTGRSSSPASARTPPSATRRGTRCSTSPTGRTS
jgi:glyoxylase-like metal-dependent hydrolase (beta-lactamase superfamily II)